MKDLYKETAVDLSLKLKNKEISPVELAASVFGRISEAEEDVKAFITTLEAEAEESAKRVKTGGPLAGMVADATWAVATKWHIWLFDVILFAVGLHILASILYLVWKRENLVKPMITGRKPAADFEDQPEAQVETIGRALICLIAAILLVFGGIMTFGGKIF